MRLRCVRDRGRRQPTMRGLGNAAGWAGGDAQVAVVTALLDGRCRLGTHVLRKLLLRARHLVRVNLLRVHLPRVHLPGLHLQGCTPAISSASPASRAVLPSSSHAWGGAAGAEAAES
eukprot:scaffold3372_cov54-Phaeocystis_antarctica.AAC.4